MGKIVRRIPPCPAYDLEAMESWLMDMAREGLHLEEQGISCGVANFQRGEPRETQYRLVGYWKPPTLLQATVTGFGEYRGIDPAEEEQKLNWLFGWEYVAKRGKFFIYRAVDPAPRELDTDPLIQSMTLRALAQWDGLRFLWALPVGFLLALLRMPGDLLTAAPLLPLSWVLMTLAMLAHFLTGALHSKRVARWLNRGLPLDHHKDWRTGARRHHLWQALFVGAFLFFPVALILSFAQL